MIRWLLVVLIALLPLVSGYTDSTSHSRAVVMLVDTSGTYTNEIQKAQAIANYLLATLQPGDSLAVARIDTGSFSEKDIIQKQTFEDRPSMANQQKRQFRENINSFITGVTPSSYTDITGGVLQAVEYLNESRSGITQHWLAGTVPRRSGHRGAPGHGIGQSLRGPSAG